MMLMSNHPGVLCEVISAMWESFVMSAEVSVGNVQETCSKFLRHLLILSMKLGSFRSSHCVYSHFHIIVSTFGGIILEPLIQVLPGDRFSTR